MKSLHDVSWGISWKLDSELFVHDVSNSIGILSNCLIVNKCNCNFACVCMVGQEKKFCIRSLASEKNLSKAHRYHHSLSHK